MNHLGRHIITCLIVAGATVGLSVIAHAETTPSCSSGQVDVTNGGEQAAAGHRSVLLVFSLAPGTAACTLTGYPGVSSGAGGPLIHADWTQSGYMGGVQSDAPPVVTVSASQPAYAVVEGAAVGDSDQPCPTYTGLQVIPPDTTDAVTVPAGIDVCGLQVHPVNSQP